MPLNLIHGPPNSGRAGIVRRRFTEALGRSPVLVLPTLDDVYAFERELCREEGALLGGAVHTFDGLFEQVATAAGRLCPPRIRRAQRERLVSVAVARSRPRILARSAARPGFAAAAAGLVGRAAGGDARPLRGRGGGLRARGLRLSGRAGGDLPRLRRAARLRSASPTATCSPARRSPPLEDDPDSWQGRPVFLYGFDDLTREQLRLVAALSRRRPGHRRPHLRGPPRRWRRGRPCSSSSGRSGRRPRRRPSPTRPTPRARCSTRSNAASAITTRRDREARRQPGAAPLRRRARRGGGDRLPRSRGCSPTGTPPGEIAIAVRDPAGRGRLLAAVLESYGVPVALEADVPVAGTATGGALLSLLAAAFTSRTAADLLAYLRGPRRGWPPRSTGSSGKSCAAGFAAPRRRPLSGRSSRAAS